MSSTRTRISDHAKHMLLGVAAILVLLLAVRVPFGAALIFVVLLACLLMMAVMMWSMGRDSCPHSTRTPSAAEPGEVRGAEHDGIPRPGR